jgi:hypothetical protein
LRLIPTICLRIRAYSGRIPLDASLKHDRCPLLSCRGPVTVPAFAACACAWHLTSGPLDFLPASYLSLPSYAPVTRLRHSFTLVTLYTFWYRHLSLSVSTPDSFNLIVTLPGWPVEVHTRRSIHTLVQSLKIATWQVRDHRHNGVLW